MAIANRHNFYVIEDTAQSLMSGYKGRALGSIGHLSAFSFHETKNYTRGGEVGLLVIRDERFIERAEVIREKGKNRSQFFCRMFDKYQWVDIRSSYLASQLQAALLRGQLESADIINSSRQTTWGYCRQEFLSLAEVGQVELACISENYIHNAHIFCLKTSGLKERGDLINYLKVKSIFTVFHYVLLHNSEVGKEFGRFNGADRHASSESEWLVWLPMWFGHCLQVQKAVVAGIEEFYA